MKFFIVGVKYDAKRWEDACMEENINRLTEIIKNSNNIVFFGGAGVSTESGVKDYRSKDGLYNTVRQYGVSPEVILSKSFFERDPETFYDFYRNYFVIEAEPNYAHKALAELERQGKLKAVITQNIDGLHQKAGSKSVIELHGTVKEYICHDCRRKSDSVLDVIVGGKIPRCSFCGGVIRPNIVMYEERLFDGVEDMALNAIMAADVLIVGGTSLAVYPANMFLRYFRGSHFVIINKTGTQYDNVADLVMRDNIGEMFKKVMDKLG